MPAPNVTTQAAPARRPVPRELAKILADCRDITVHRLLLSMSALADRLCDMLMERAGRSDIRDEQQLYLEARQLLITGRADLMSGFESRLRGSIEDQVSGRAAERADFSKADASKLALVDLDSIDLSVVVGNIVRAMENACHEELVTLNRGIGHLLGRSVLESAQNPLGPATVVNAFAEALDKQTAEARVKFQVLKELNVAPLREFASIYADVNRHLANLRIIPPGSGRHAVTRSRDNRRRRATDDNKPDASQPSPETDVMSMFRRASAHGGFPLSGHPPPPSRVYPSLPPTPSGYVPGAPIVATPGLREGLTRLQGGETQFDVEGMHVAFSGIPQGTQNVLRNLQESPLGQRANQLEAMTIEMVAMLFDFIFETRDLPDGIKALLARLQIPVLKVAMLDGAFFAKKTHPSRLLVNALASAGLGWSPAMGQDDPLYRTIERIVRRIVDGFGDNLAIFDELRAELEAFLASEERSAEENFSATADAINEGDRRDLASVIAKSEIERRIESYPIPRFLAQFLRSKWQSALEGVYLRDGDESETWSTSVATLEDLVWSVQPKRTPEDRKHLIALLPSLLKRLAMALPLDRWQGTEREAFMSNLVEAHAAAVKPGLASVASPTAAVAEQAKAEAQVAKAAGDVEAAARAEALALAMAPAEPVGVEAGTDVLEDEYLEIARSLDRGTWVEFEDEDGALSFAKLAWISPLRGTYLFTNRTGQKAVSMTAEALADQFRVNRARLVEAEPLIDRALTSVMSELQDRFELEPATV
ncbi:MAG TPA: DUF1631 domain-containing protein [Casimicrobiaceae bacterium]|nr:DUF1631 domain-containing protein [Casimicrobiaceae bacterium]